MVRYPASSKYDAGWVWLRLFMRMIVTVNLLLWKLPIKYYSLDNVVIDVVVLNEVTDRGLKLSKINYWVLWRTPTSMSRLAEQVSIYSALNSLIYDYEKLLVMFVNLHYCAQGPACTWPTCVNLGLCILRKLKFTAFEKAYNRPTGNL